MVNVEDFKLRATIASLRSRVASAEDDAKKIVKRVVEENPGVVSDDIEEDILEAEAEELEKDGADVDAEPSAFDKAEKGKYTAKTQPRDAQGKFRKILARLKNNLGTSGNQAVLEKIEEAENLDNAGNYTGAVGAAEELIDTVDRLDSGALNADSVGNVRLATENLGKVIANLPLPFENQAQKVRFSDLPPTLKKLSKDLIKKVEQKIGKQDADEATQELRSFMSGNDVYSQSEISAQLNRLLRLLT
jgi:hypothetical protein